MFIISTFARSGITNGGFFLGLNYYASRRCRRERERALIKISKRNVRKVKENPEAKIIMWLEDSRVSSRKEVIFFLIRNKDCYFLWKLSTGMHNNSDLYHVKFLVNFVFL